MTFTIGSGSTAKSCTGTTDDNGNASCPITPVNQPTSSVSVTSSFPGSSYDTSATSTPVPATVLEPTSLSVNTTTSDFADQTTVSGVLTDTVTTAPARASP